MIPRKLSESALKLVQHFPILYLGGPRQSGKTTLIKHLFNHLPYSNLENPDTRLLAEEDPRRYLESFDHGAILDEVQRVPHLFSYLQELVDKDREIRFILSGSHNFLLMQKITQSLAGRVGILTLLPFGLGELPDSISSDLKPEKFAWQGGYPVIYDRQSPPALMYPNYVETYLQRDVRLLLKVGDLSRFNRFIRLCAGRAGTVINYSTLARDADIAVNTAKSWLSILEASYLVFFLQPYFKNFNKRLIKSPKLYFTDSGLLCNLLGIEHVNQLDTHYLFGNIIENMIIGELYKKSYHQGQRPQFWFWRDSNGNEIDLLIQQNNELRAIEIKSSKTFHSRHFSQLGPWQNISDTSANNSFVIYLGDQQQTTQYGQLVPWKKAILDKLIME